MYFFFSDTEIFGHVFVTFFSLETKIGLSLGEKGYCGWPNQMVLI